MEDYSAIRIPMSRAIRERCLDCCCWQRDEVKRCANKCCPLWRYRSGKEQRDSLYTPNNRGQNKQSVQGFQSIEGISDDE